MKRTNRIKIISAIVLIAVLFASYYSKSIILYAEYCYWRFISNGNLQTKWINIELPNNWWVGEIVNKTVYLYRLPEKLNQDALVAALEKRYAPESVFKNKIQFDNVTLVKSGNIQFRKIGKDRLLYVKYKEIRNEQVGTIQYYIWSIPDREITITVISNKKSIQSKINELLDSLYAVNYSKKL